MTISVVAIKKKKKHFLFNVKPRGGEKLCMGRGHDKMEGGLRHTPTC